MELDKDYFKNDNVTSNATVESFLMEDETILWRGKAKKSAYVAGKSLALAPIAILWLCIDIAFISLIFGSGAPGFIGFFIIPFFALHLMPVWLWIYSMVKATREQKTIEYVITNERVIEFRGDPRYIYKSVELNSIVDVSLRINFIDKFLGVGDITIVSDKDIYISKLNINENIYSNSRLRNTNSRRRAAQIETNSLVISDIEDSISLHKKLLNICQENKSNDGSNAPERVVCKNCGTAFDALEIRCPSCGAPNGKK